MATESKYPDSILVQTNLTGTVDRIDEDPDSPDANWLTASNGTGVLHVTFANPTGPLTAGTDNQEFRVQLRLTTDNSNSGTAHAYLYDNGTQAADLGTSSVLTEAAAVYSWTWDTTDLGGTSGTNVELYITLPGYSGAPIFDRYGTEVGAVEWNVVYSPGETVNFYTTALTLTPQDFLVDESSSPVVIFNTTALTLTPQSFNATYIVEFATASLVVSPKRFSIGQSSAGTRALSAKTQTAIESTFTAPRFLVELGFSTTLRFCTRETVEWNGSLWSSKDLTLKGFANASGGIMRGDITVANHNLGWSALILSEGVKDKAAKVWILYGDYVPGTEQVTNGTFDTDTTGWTSIGTYTGYSVSNGKLTADVPVAQYMDLYQSLTLTPGHQYNLTVDLIDRISGDKACNVIIYEWDGSSYSTSTQLENVNFNEDPFTGTFIPTQADIRVRIFVGLNSTQDTEVEFDGISITAAGFDYADAVPLFDGVMDEVPTIGDYVTIRCVSNTAYAQKAPRIRCAPPVLNYMPPSGTVITGGGYSLTLESSD